MSWPGWGSLMGKTDQSGARWVTAPQDQGAETQPAHKPNLSPITNPNNETEDKIDWDGDHKHGREL